MLPAETFYITPLTSLALSRHFAPFSQELLSYLDPELLLKMSDWDPRGFRRNAKPINESPPTDLIRARDIYTTFHLLPDYGTPTSFHVARLVELGFPRDPAVHAIRLLDDENGNARWTWYLPLYINSQSRFRQVVHPRARNWQQLQALDARQNPPQDTASTTVTTTPVIPSTATSSLPQAQGLPHQISSTARPRNLHEYTALPDTNSVTREDTSQLDMLPPTSSVTRTAPPMFFTDRQNEHTSRSTRPHSQQQIPDDRTATDLRTEIQQYGELLAASARLSGATPQSEVASNLLQPQNTPAVPSMDALTSAHAFTFAPPSMLATNPFSAADSTFAPAFDRPAVDLDAALSSSALTVPFSPSDQLLDGPNPEVSPRPRAGANPAPSTPAARGSDQAVASTPASSPVDVDAFPTRCEPCHKRKKGCDGGRPCAQCVQQGNTAKECIPRYRLKHKQLRRKAGKPTEPTEAVSEPEAKRRRLDSGAGTPGVANSNPVDSTMASPPHTASAPRTQDLLPPEASTSALPSTPSLPDPLTGPRIMDPHVDFRLYQQRQNMLGGTAQAATTTVSSSVLGNAVDDRTNNSDRHQENEASGEEVLEDQ